SNASSSNVSIISSWGNADFKLPLAGDFNVANALDVLATLLCWDIPLADACAVLEKVTAPPGRMQYVDIENGKGFPAVYVDYSHTPASLEAALNALRPHCSGELWCVFGCGGDRDRGKRPMMGKVAALHSDCPVVTSDNPRSESPQEIMRDVLEGMEPGTTAIEDRSAAIEYAVSRADSTDTVLVAGKGHEHYQLIGNERVRFSDYETAAASLKIRRDGNVAQS
ncbi:MAG: UDP-N-acetylmuramoyl-L-alanyl-D-glutamate--2,6-diaminopimelate ligase, partial [Woeseiaceae bacterium]